MVYFCADRVVGLSVVSLINSTNGHPHPIPKGSQVYPTAVALVLVQPLPNSEGIRNDHQRQIRQFIILFTFEVSTSRTTMNPLMAASHSVTLVDVV